MGWARGSALLSDVIDKMFETNVSDEDRKLLYSILIEAFENYDCDTVFECVGIDPAFDEAYKEFNPNYDFGDLSEEE